MATMARDTNKLLDQAAQSIDAVARRAKDALYQASRSDAAQQARDGAWKLAQRARGQAGDLADQAYERGQRTVSALRDQVEEQPVTALLVVALFGFILGYLIRATR
jgi:ElaB/YqjD/DUF883 family membrane-anchored ribosome-binding protein